MLPDVVAEALRQAAALLVSSPEPEPDAVRGSAGDEVLQGPRRRGCDADAACLGDTTVAELSARAERSGWNTSVHFLEKNGAVRLRLVRQPEKGDDNRPRSRQ